MKHFWPYFAIITAMVIWSVSGIAIKAALVVLPPLTMIVMRFSLSVMLMLIIGLIAHRSPMLALQSMDKKDFPLFLLGGFFQPFLYYILETYTYNALSSPTIAETLLSTAPLIAPVFAAILLREHVSAYNIVGILISTLGVVLLILFGSQSFSIGNPWGVLLATLAVSSAVLYTIVLRKTPTHYSSLTVVFYVQLLSLCMFIPLWAFTEGPSALQSIISTNIESVEYTKAFGAVAYLAIFASVTAFILFCYTVRQIGVTRANAFNNIRPVFTALWMLLLFGEKLPFIKIFGILLIIVGLFICQKRSKSA